VKAKQMRDTPDHELAEQIGDLRAELRRARFANATGELEDTASLARKRRELARALTIARERRLGIEARGGA
jgi:large subunit ribosomal protein L29